MTEWRRCRNLRGTEPVDSAADLTSGPLYASRVRVRGARGQWPRARPLLMAGRPMAPASPTEPPTRRDHRDSAFRNTDWNCLPSMRAPRMGINAPMALPRKDLGTRINVTCTSVPPAAGVSL